MFVALRKGIGYLTGAADWPRVKDIPVLTGYFEIRKVSAREAGAEIGSQFGSLT
jgi:hypothetical protein